MSILSLPIKLRWLAVLLSVFCAPLLSRAQLVSDGQTNFLDGVVTNVSDVAVGTNGSFTLLVVTNGSAVTNNGTLVIGNFVSARSNLVVITGAGSIWTNTSSFIIGAGGSYNQFQILAGGVARGGDGSLGAAPGSSSNIVVVSDAGSFWRSSYVHVGGGPSAANANLLIISNGAAVSSGNADIGPNFSSNNVAIVTDVNSVWTNSASLNVGGNSSHSLLLVTNGGKVFSANSSIGQSGAPTIPSAAIITGAGSSWNSGYLYVGLSSPGGNQLIVNNGGSYSSSNTVDIGDNDNSNLLSVADPGSSVTCQSFLLGSNSTANQCIVSNGAKLAVALSSHPTVVRGTFTRTAITGSGTLWTNGGDFDFGQFSNVLSITGGAMLVDSNGVVENGAGKPNTVIISGAGSVWKNLHDFHMEDSGSQLLITNGGTLTDNNAFFGQDGNTNAFALLAGPGSLWTNSSTLYVGYSGSTNKVLVTDSAVVKAAGSIVVGYQGYANQLIVSNSAFVGTPNLQIGAGNSLGDNVTLTGGTILANFINDQPYSTIIFNGGTLQTAGISCQNPTPFTVGDGTNPAVLTLMGGHHSFSGGLVVSNNGVLNGSGYISNSVVITSGGTISPGTNNTDLAILFPWAGVTLKPGSATIMKLNALSNKCDQLRGLPTITLGGTLQLTNVAGTLQSGQSYQLFVSTPFLGAFSSLNPPTPGPGLRWDTNQLSVNGFLRVFSVPTPPPQIGVSNAPDGSLVLTTQGIPYDPCYLLTSTNLSMPLTNWTYIATNYFDAGGNTSFTRPPLGLPQQFFQVQVN
jgi:T5SS/PEP-CTERM-associated repeat protein